MTDLAAKYADPRPYYGTSVVGDDAACTFEQRLGRCYQLAAYALALGTAPEDATLVHGAVKSLVPGTQTIDHAWLELADGTVWEPITRKFWHAQVWSDFARPRRTRRYSQMDVLDCILEHGHWGPWPVKRAKKTQSS